MPNLEPGYLVNDFKFVRLGRVAAVEDSRFSLQRLDGRIQWLPRDLVFLVRAVVLLS
jgi:hypothetical protein